MIIVSKLLKYNSNILIACLSTGMLIIVGFHIFMTPYNYRRIDLYLCALGVVYVLTIFFVSFPLSKNQIMTILVSITFLFVIV